MGLWQIVRKTKEFYGWYRFAVAVALLFASGAGLAIGGVVWLVEAGIPLPIALMAGYCTLVGAVYLAMAPMAFRFLAKSQIASSPIRVPPKVLTRDALKEFAKLHGYDPRFLRDG